MTTMTGQSIRKGALLNSGTLSPNPWDLTLSGQNVWPYTGGTRTEDKAPRGCDLRAGSAAGMARAAAMLRPPQNTKIPTRPRLTYCGPKMVLTEGSTLALQAFDQLLAIRISTTVSGQGVYGPDLNGPVESGRSAKLATCPASEPSRSIHFFS